MSVIERLKLAVMSQPERQQYALEKYNQQLPFDASAKASRTAALLNTWRTPPPNTYNYERTAREGYGSNEIIYACIEQLCMSITEATWVAIDKGGTRLYEHPILDLMAKPNPTLNKSGLIGNMILYRSIAGNSYVEKVRSAAGRIVELWTLRPDRMTIQRGPEGVATYTYRLGGGEVVYSAEDVGHYKTRNPLDDLYGLPPMAVLLSRTDTDNFAKEFTKAFFFNAGVPQTLMAFKTSIEEEERAMIKSSFRQNYTGPAGWHNVMVTENAEVDVKQLGMPFGARGIAYPELDEINEARIAMVYGVPLSMLGARLGQKNGSYANKLSDRQQFWMETLMPLCRELAESFNAWLVPEFPDLDSIEIDLESIEALHEEVDAKTTRVRTGFSAGMLGFREGRKMLGIVDDPAPDDIMMVPSNMIIMKASDFLAGKMPEPAAQQPGQGDPKAPSTGETGTKKPVMIAGE